MPHFLANKLKTSRIILGNPTSVTYYVLQTKILTQVLAFKSITESVLTMKIMFYIDNFPR